MCQCFFRNGVFTTVYIDLTILVPVMKPTLLINNSIPVEGAPVMLNCSVENGTGPILYTWQRYTIQDGLSAVPESTENVLILPAANRIHIGWYSCTVRNVVNEVTSGRSYLDVRFGPDEPVIEIKPYAISEKGFAASEQEEVTLNCSALSNPPCHYVWFYNNSQVYSGQIYVLPRISRRQSGLYTCLAQNDHLKTRTQLTITLTVFYLPEGSPACTALSHNNYKDVALWCSWEGGLPLAQVRWLKSSEEDNVIVSYSNSTKIQRASDIQNGSTYTCAISHPALRFEVTCSTTILFPAGGPNCSAKATKQNDYVMLTCEWPGGHPRAVLEWNNKEIGDSKESSNIYVLKSDPVYNGKLFTCSGLHPMNADVKQCLVRLESPVLEKSGNISVLEGNDAQMSCHMKPTNLISEIIWYDNKNKEITSDSQKYGILKESGTSTLTVRETEWNVDSGLYRCLAFNAVGNSSILIWLQVNKYPTPPNVTISKLLYSRQRTEVDLEWMTQGIGDLTGFMVQRQASIRSFTGPRRAAMTSSWDTVASDIEPEIRGHKLGGLDPAIVYAFRIIAVNHRTTGFPSEVKTPADPPFNAYPAVIGAGVTGMIVATVASLLIFQYIVRNRENNPRLHDLFFRPAPADARENIRNPEDAETGADAEEGITNPAAEEVPGDSSNAVSEPTPVSDADIILTQMPVSEQPEDDPVNVTITVTTTP
ncbi:V-set and immunoglobulin domain-containing protein 10-like 2 [Pelobates fuscus]|uniref:V-set and immunoglobulin domain-containing protein 10-like 2 n=1 Tax=Pelobates fuscus TaxID=191477 RepID=UPI002FE481CB